MATQPTQNAVPSESPRDLKFNAGKIDEFVTSLVSTYVDRFGNEHYTIEGLRWLAQQAIAQYGWIPVGTFQAGATLTLPNQILKDTTDGEYYRWDGTLLPSGKIVPAGSTPSTSGGTGVGAWLSVGDSTLRAMLAAPGGDKMIGSSHSNGSIYDDYPYKGDVRPSKIIYPTMTNSQIQSVLSSGSEIYVSDGTYDVADNTQTWKLAQNSRITFSAGAILRATGDGVTILRMSSSDVSSQFIRNARCFSPRINLNGRSACIGIHLYNARNNTGLYYPWIDMGLGQNNTGIKIEFMSYGVTVRDPEVVNGGVGGRRIFILNGPNAINIENHRGYSGDPANKCDYGIVIYNSTDGSTDVDYSTTFTTAAVNITGGFSQNTSLYGLFDSADGTNVYGMYFERNDEADISLSTGSRDFYCAGINHSHSIGKSMYRGRGCVGAVIQDPNNGLRQQWFDFVGSAQCYAFLHRARAFPAGTVVPIGTTEGLSVSRGSQSFAQYTASNLPIDIRQGYEIYYVNVTSGMNITVTGTPYNGQKINMMVRGSSIASLSFAGTPVDVTGANTTAIKNAVFTATYWSALNKWTLTMPQWTAST